MKKLIILMSITCLVAGCGLGPNGQIIDALNGVLAPECSEAEARVAMGALAESPDINILASKLGTNNFTTFFIALKSDSPLSNTDQYEWQLGAPDVTLLAHYINKHMSAIAPRDINNLAWKIEDDDDSINGSFSVSTPYGLQASFLFHAKQSDKGVRVTKLVVKKKKSNNMSDGFKIMNKQ